ncbi:hydrogenase/urease accessory protein HupE [Paenibacillus endophyticus]|uniref:Hydrogenase/urease accessory protein HupE n=1 Tax=Paenibacillus endophyticus TaxID=1294268 RepID=A0A7W5C9I8_9BACL|nr:HupE/UreJ family protein [Paenibacillus endophyticus]MBB3153633.1 hydrogenase/urease accessory protein HupE [Paenibacillus endophyticus]
MISAFIAFFRLGMEHILTGYDHLLFLFSLLIARQTIKQYATVITAFTIAHCLTLTLTVLDIINVPSSFVEPAIALSICYVAIENMFRRDVKNRWMITFVFGLIHGMGFADLLKGMDLPKNALGFNIFSFNLGIEAAQIGILVVLLPLLFFAQKWKYSVRVVNICSAIACVLGGVWLTERIF